MPGLGFLPAAYSWASSRVLKDLSVQSRLVSGGSVTAVGLLLKGWRLEKYPGGGGSKDR